MCSCGLMVLNVTIIVQNKHNLLFACLPSFEVQIAFNQSYSVKPVSNGHWKKPLYKNGSPVKEGEAWYTDELKNPGRGEAGICGSRHI